MGDEFFFMVCGFYLSKSANGAVIDPIKWNIAALKKRIQKIAIPYYFTWLACFIGRRITCSVMGEQNKPVLLDIANSVYELLFLEMFGFKKGLYSNDVGWFFSALLIVTFIVGVLIVKYKKAFSLYLSPLITLLLYGMLSLNYDYLHDPYFIIPNTYLMKGLVRALAAICVGVFIEGIVDGDWVCHKIGGLNKTKKSIIWLIDVLIWLVIVGYMIYPFSSNSDTLSIQYDYIIVILMAFALVPVFSIFEKSNKKGIVNVIAGTLGTFSFYAYFGQAVFYSFDTIVYRMNINMFYKALILNVGVLVISMILWMVTKRIRRIASHII